jgi:hypothetical protein
MEKIRDPGWKKFGSGIIIPDPQHCCNITYFLTPQDGGEEEGEEAEYGEGEEEGEGGLQEREQRAKQRQIMKEIRAKKVRCDSSEKKFLSFKKFTLCRISQCSALSSCSLARVVANPYSFMQIRILGPRLRMQHSVIGIIFLFVCLIFIGF